MGARSDFALLMSYYKTINSDNNWLKNSNNAMKSEWYEKVCLTSKI